MNEANYDNAPVSSLNYETDLSNRVVGPVGHRLLQRRGEWATVPPAYLQRLGGREDTKREREKERDSFSLN